jgi:hypothetical protein
MSRNGSGTYTLPAGNPVVSGTTITSTWANGTLSDIATALTGSIASDGQTPMTGGLNMGSNKISNLGIGTTAGDAVEYTQITSAVDITGGVINGTIIGNVSPQTGKFTTLEATTSGTIPTLNSTTINATTVNATTLNGTVVGKFTTTNFTIEESGGKLVFKYGATSIASLSSTGVFTTLTSNVSGGTP